MSLRDVGARVRLYDGEGGNVGVAHMPRRLTLASLLFESGEIAAARLGHGPKARLRVRLAEIERYLDGGPH